METPTEPWLQALSQATEVLLVRMASVLPSLMAGLLLLIIGYVLARVARMAVLMLVNRTGVETLAQATGINRWLERLGSGFSLGQLLSQLTFWMIVLIFLVSAVEAMGLPQLTATIDTFVLYLPRLLAAVLILLFGLALASAAGDVVYKSAEAAGFDFARPVSRMVNALLVLLVVSLAIGQLNIDTYLINLVIVILLSALGLGAAISLGLGSRSASENILYSLYIADTVAVGDRVQLKDGSIGTVENIGAVATTIAISREQSLVVRNVDVLDQLRVLKPAVD